MGTIVNDEHQKPGTILELSFKDARQLLINGKAVPHEDKPKPISTRNDDAERPPAVTSEAKKSYDKNVKELAAELVPKKKGRPKKVK